MHKQFKVCMILGLVTVSFSASAAPPPWAPAHGRRAKEAQSQVTVIERQTVIYRRADGSYYCRRSDGTVGMIAGAVIGGVIGNRLAPGKSATLGTLLGAGAGALIGQQLDKGTVHCQ